MLQEANTSCCPMFGISLASSTVGAFTPKPTTNAVGPVLVKSSRTKVSSGKVSTGNWRTAMSFKPVSASYAGCPNIKVGDDEACVVNDGAVK